jgi:D-alanyl-lipoteichoic acid acyltransferase DltB (MBOAT superfamily)
MLFDSYHFFVFLPVVYLLYWSASRRVQNALLLVASYVFYGWWDWRFLGLIVASSLVDYVAALGIVSGRRRRAWLALSLVVNLGALGVFKYLDFGIESFAALLEAIGLTPHLPTLRLVLPVGISFYTFQTLSYTIDVYRGRLEPTRDVLAFFAFVAFFPQLVAGPIERAEHLLTCFLHDRRFDASRAADGCRQILYGLFLKIVVADNLASIVDAAYAHPDRASGSALLFGTYAFAFQIYGDFAGYSHIAIGCGRLFGIDLRRNFAYPYFSQSPAEFWRRWHISLSTWFRDYVYIPLGGGRGGAIRRACNVLVTFVLSGLWHGAGATFVVWGGLHGLFVAAQGWAPRTDLADPVPTVSLRALVRVVLTFHLMSLAWVFFRAPTTSDATGIVRRIAGAVVHGEIAAPDDMLLLLVGTVVGIEWRHRRAAHPLQLDTAAGWQRWAAYGTLVLAMALFGRVETIPFIYFQF